MERIQELGYNQPGASCQQGLEGRRKPRGKKQKGERAMCSNLSTSWSLSAVEGSPMAIRG